MKNIITVLLIFLIAAFGTAEIHPPAGLSEVQIEANAEVQKGVTAYDWGNHASAGYQTTALLRQTLSVSTSTDTSLYIYDGARTTYYDLTLTGDVQADTVIFNDGQTPQDGDSLILRVTASGAGRIITLLEGGDGTFLFGSSLVALDISQTAQDKTDYIGCTWNDSKKRWLIVSYAKGF